MTNFDFKLVEGQVSTSGEVQFLRGRGQHRLHRVLEGLAGHIFKVLDSKFGVFKSLCYVNICYAQ